MTCDCQDWKDNLSHIYGTSLMVAIHGMEYAGKQWKYCPWCGKELQNDHEIEDAINRVKNFRDRYQEWAEVSNNDENLKALNMLIMLIAFCVKERPKERKKLARMLYDTLDGPKADYDPLGDFYPQLAETAVREVERVIDECVITGNILDSIKLKAKLREML